MGSAQRNIAIAIVTAAIILAGAWVFIERGNTPTTLVADTSKPADTDTTTLAPEAEGEEVVVTYPTPNETIASPLTAQGKAHGSWFFEAIMGVKIEDAKGRELGSAALNAQGEWMTAGFVPFVGTVSFKKSETKTGFVVFMNDNASGLPQHNKEFRVPVVFTNVGTDTAATPPKDLTLKAYFLKTAAVPASQDECVTVFPVERKVAYTQGVAKAALGELLKGPTAAEVAAGYTTNINAGVTLKSIRIENGVAYADFDSLLEKNVGGSCRTSSIISQIRTTLLQFPTVKEVKISIEGKSEYILQP